MPSIGMRSPYSLSPSRSSQSTPRRSISTLSTPRRCISSLSTPRRSFSSESTIEQSIDAAASIIRKWNPDTSKSVFLFYENKREAMQFLKCVNDLQNVMYRLASESEGSKSETMVQAHDLMQIAMKRLQLEFYQILSVNRAYLDPGSVSMRSSRASTRFSSFSDYDDFGSLDEEIRATTTATSRSICDVDEVSDIAMADLRSIADCMISNGYSKECIHMYIIIRKSIIDESMYRLGIQRISSSQIHKMDWEVLDLKIKKWLEAVKISMRTLFHGERILCDHVFGASDSIRKSCFHEISKNGANLLFSFPEIVAKFKKSPREKIFGVLKIYSAISEFWPEIESIFSFESTSAVRLQALNSLVSLSESARSLIRDFESAIEKDSSKVPIPGGGLHPLTLQSMNYLSLLADYSDAISDIFTDWPLPAKHSSLPESYFDSPVSGSGESTAPEVSIRIAWIILLILCKLDGKAEQYKSVILSYLFLANNLQHVVSRVRTSNLQYLLGEEWIENHEEKVKQFSANYERLAWGPVFASLPETTAAISAEEAKEYFRKFNSSFEEAYSKQKCCVVPDQKLREEMTVSITKKLVPAYREFYGAYGVTVQGERNGMSFVRFTPEDVEKFLSGLLFGLGNSGNSLASSAPSPHRLFPLFKWRR